MVVLIKISIEISAYVIFYIYVFTLEAKKQNKTMIFKENNNMAP